jgi:hypothetical protein
MNTTTLMGLSDGSKGTYWVTAPIRSSSRVKADVPSISPHRVS